MMLDQDRYWDCLDQAMQASSGGRVDEALAWLDEALRANPEGVEAYNGRGEILWDSGRPEEALREFTKAAAASPDLFAAHLNRIEILIEEFQEHEQALDLGDELLERSLESGVEAEVYYLKAKALFYCDDLDGAYFLLRRAIKLEAEIAVYRGFEGQILFEQGRFEAALRALKHAFALDPESAHTLYHCALVHEQMGGYAESERYFVRAAQVAPDVYPLPIRVAPDEFQAITDDAVRSLPAIVRRHLESCAVRVAELPSLELIRRENVSPQVLGLFDGVPLNEMDGGPKSETDCIWLFKRNLEKVAMTHEDLTEQIQITVQHEIGHYLGLDEEQIEQLSLN